MAWSVTKPIDYTPNGDTTAVAVNKFMGEFDNVYDLLNRLRTLDSGTKAPTDPSNGAIWLDTNNYMLKYYNGSDWVEMLPASKFLSLLKTVDGAGSGLDADLLDGLQGSQFARYDIASRLLTYGRQTPKTDRTVNGAGRGIFTWSYYNHPTGSPSSYGEVVSFGAGSKGHAEIAVSWYGRADMFVRALSNNTTDNWTSWAKVWTNQNDGSGSGLDADLLDGHDSSYFLPKTAKAVDSDKLDGHDSSYFAVAGHNHNYNVDNQWLRVSGDNANFKIYGNSRQMVFRTDGNREYTSSIGNSPFIWMYGGDGASNKRMVLDRIGQIWTHGYGWLHDCFVQHSQYAGYNNANGYSKLPNGLIIQWGYTYATDSSNKSVTFPIAFPNACYVVMITAERTRPGSNGWNYFNSKSKTSVTIGTDGRGYWMAIGY